jgi:hypothetical protein
MAIKPQQQNLDEFCDYLFETYISEESIFPPQIWSSEFHNLLNITNACEFFHAVLKSNFNTTTHKFLISSKFWRASRQIPTLKSALLDQEPDP